MKLFVIWCVLERQPNEINTALDKGWASSFYDMVFVDGNNENGMVETSLGMVKMKVHFDLPALEATLCDYIHEVEHAAERLTRLEKAIHEAACSAPQRMRAVIEALQALRGIAEIGAVTIVAEVGELSRFQGARQLMGYSGLVPSEYSSGARRIQSSITKTGNAHLRRVMVEAAWAYQFRPWLGGYLLKRQTTLNQEVKEIAWKAEHRLHRRYLQLLHKGKNKPQIVTAIGRTLGIYLVHWSPHRTSTPQTHGCSISHSLCV